MFHLLGACTVTANQTGMCLIQGGSGSTVGVSVVTPVMTVLMVALPVMVVIGTLHRLTEHRDSAGSLIIELFLKAGGTFLTILLIRTVFGI